MIGLNITDVMDPFWPKEMTHYRIWDAGAAWCQIHTGPRTYNWNQLDLIMAKAGDRHITYVVGGCPQWLAKYPNNPHPASWLGAGSNSMPYDVDVFNEFIWHLATRYKGRINAYEIWNEPQLPDFMFPYTDAECHTLARMTKRAYSTIKTIDPEAAVLAASVLPRATSGGMVKARKFLTALKEKGWPVDIMTCHIYPEVGTGAKRWKNMLQDVSSTMDVMGAPNRLWITETAYGLLGPIIPDDKAKQLVEDTYEATNRFIFWYAWNRPDLGGMQVGSNTAAWDQIKVEGAK